MATEATLRVAFWNTWLLRPRLWRGGPAVPGGDRFFAPDVTRRAPLVGAAIRDRFDVVALAEVFEPSEQRSVAAAVPSSNTIRSRSVRPLYLMPASAVAMRTPSIAGIFG